MLQCGKLHLHLHRVAGVALAVGSTTAFFATRALAIDTVTTTMTTLSATGRTAAVRSTLAVGSTGALLSTSCASHSSCRIHGSSVHAPVTLFAANVAKAGLLAASESYCKRCRSKSAAVLTEALPDHFK